jgi:hypothetical protein
MTDEEILTQFEKMGEAEVRLHLANGSFGTQYKRAAFKWLAPKDQESKRLMALSQAEQMELARNANQAAWTAATAAIIAAIVAIISAIISYLSWSRPHP